MDSEGSLCFQFQEHVAVGIRYKLVIFYFEKVHVLGALSGQLFRADCALVIYCLNFNERA